MITYAYFCIIFRTSQICLTTCYYNFFRAHVRGGYWSAKIDDISLWSPASTLHRERAFSFQDSEFFIFLHSGSELGFAYSQPKRMHFFREVEYKAKASPPLFWSSVRCQLMSLGWKSKGVCVYVYQVYSACTKPSNGKPTCKSGSWKIKCPVGTCFDSLCTVERLDW